MRVAFFHSSKSWSTDLAHWFKHGVERCGDECELRHLDDPIGDAIDVLGLVGGHPRVWAKLQGRNLPVLYVDKGYTRNGQYFRTSLNARQPTRYLMNLDMPPNRREEFKWVPAGWKPKSKRGSKILYVCGGRAYCKQENLGTPENCAANVVAQLRNCTDREVIYRPRPNLPPGIVPGTIQSWGIPLASDLVRSYAIITHGSSTCLTAMMEGIPAVILGDAVTRPISSTSLSQIEELRYASLSDQMKLLNNLAYHQWSIEEFRSGMMWSAMCALLFSGVIPCVQLSPASS